MIPLEKIKMLTPLQRLPKMVEDLDKWDVAKGFEKLPNVQKIAQSGHTVHWQWHCSGCVCVCEKLFRYLLGMKLDVCLFEKWLAEMVDRKEWKKQINLNHIVISIAGIEWRRFWTFSAIFCILSYRTFSI